jgi:hypothetical protein
VGKAVKGGEEAVKAFTIRQIPDFNHFRCGSFKLNPDFNHFRCGLSHVKYFNHFRCGLSLVKHVNRFTFNSTNI